MKKFLSRKLKTRLLTLGFAIVFGAVALSPLSPDAEIKTRLMVDAVGIDCTEQGVQVYCETVSGGSNEVVMGEGYTFSEAINDLNSRYGRDVEMEHCGLVAMGGDTSKSALKSVLMGILSDASINAGCTIVSADGSAKDFMNDAVRISKSVGDGITGFVTYTDEQSTVMMPSILEVMQSLFSKSATVLLPVVGFEDKTTDKGSADVIGPGGESGGSPSGSEESKDTEIVPIKHARVISDNGVQLLSEELATGLTWLQPRSEGGLLSTVIELNDAKLTIRASLEKHSYDISVKQENGELTVKVKVNAKLKFVDRFAVLAIAEKGMSLSNIIEMISDSYENTIKEQSEKLVEFSKSEDILGLKTKFYRSQPKEFYAWSGDLSGAKVLFDIKAEVV